jgi:flagellin
VDISASGLDFASTPDITGTVTLNGVAVSVSATTAGGAGDVVTAINTGIAAAKSELGYDGELDDITVAGDNATGIITFTNAATNDVAVDFNLSDDSTAAAATDDFTGETITAGNAGGDTLDLSAFDFANGGSLTITGVTDPIEIAAGQTLAQVAGTIQAELRAAIPDANLTATLDGSNVLSINAVATSPAVPGFTIASNSVGNTYAPGAQTIDAALSEALTLESAFASGEAFDFNVDINGTIYNFEGLTSLNDIVSQVNAQSNETGVNANLNSNNNEIFFSSQFGEAFTVNIQADLDSDGAFDAATETVQALTATVAADTISMNDIDISEREGADLAMIAVDYAIDTINGFRAELGAVQNRFESTIANLATTAENLSASNSRIRDADFAAESAELARTQVLQSAGLSVLAQANARPQQVLQLLQG